MAILVCSKKGMQVFVGFIGGVILGQVYYNYTLRKIPFPYYVAATLSFTVSLILGVGNAVCVQSRCISLLTLPMYCGKHGRGLWKAVVLTYVITGPIMNMGLNAKEVVRVFACSAQLSQNITKYKHELFDNPLKKALLELNTEILEAKDTLRSFRDIVAPIHMEVEGTEESLEARKEIYFIDNFFGHTHRTDVIDDKYLPKPEDTADGKYHKKYLKKMEYRCQAQLSHAVAVCMNTFATAYKNCCEAVPFYAVALALCWPVNIKFICDILHVGDALCDSEKQHITRGLGEGYAAFQKSQKELINKLDDVKLQYKVTQVRELYKIQDAKETGERVIHAFEEKNVMMRTAMIVVNVCMALLFLRIFTAAVSYHEEYLTSIGYDNIYITSYFKMIDDRRRMRNKYSLLPLKKMERSKYVVVNSFSYVTAKRHKLFTQTLKVALEVITATTFVMLDRLFYEALDVVRQHAHVDVTQKGIHDLDIQVEGTGMLAAIIRKVLSGRFRGHVRRVVTNAPCLPQPRLMPTVYFVHIYGGYLWILFLLLINPYTMRLRRLICSYFYPRREKQRILHLYNDILKKRLKMQKTLRRKAVQAVRAHYLSGESLLSIRMRFPNILGWLKLLPAARMCCLICGETEPRTHTRNNLLKNSPLSWHSCAIKKCPFVYCPECWVEVGERCLACDPSLAELSDVDSLTDEEQPIY